MNTRILFPVAAAVLAVAATSSLMGRLSFPVAERSTRIVDLPPISVRPAVEGAAYHQAQSIVELATVTVYPKAGDEAFFLAEMALQSSLACRC